MLTYNKMLKLHNELEISYRDIQKYLESVLDNDSSVVVQNRTDEGGALIIGYYDSYQEMEFQSLIASDFEFKRLMKIQTREELLSFLSARTIA